MKNIWRVAAFSLVAVLFTAAPHAHAALIAAQPDASGTPIHYFHSDGTTSAFLVLDPNQGNQPGFSIGNIATTNSSVLGIHIRVQFNTDGNLSSLPNIPYLYNETGAHPYACAQESFNGWAYGTAANALANQNPLVAADYNGKMVDMYFNCAVGTGHELLYANTPYRLYLYPVSSANVFDIYAASNAAGTQPFYEISGDGIYPTPAPITITAPQAGTTYFSTDTIIPQATILNLPSYTTIIYTLNGVVVDPTLPLPIASLPPGPASLVVAATDSLGHITYATSTFSIADTVPPTVVINTPLNGHSYLQNDMASISATITDNVAVATSTYKLNGTLIDQTQMLPFMSLPLGTNTLVVSATDTSGNAGYATSTFTLLPPDLTAPAITITSPTAGTTYTDTSVVYLTATVTDASPIAATSYTFNGATIDPLQPLPLIGAPLGAASVAIAATDAYGNASSSTVHFIIKSSDITGPTITITNPLAGHTYQSTDTVLATATITDASGVAASSYTLDGIPVDPLQPLPLALAGNGPAVLVVSATDTFGNASSSSVAFTITTPPPPDTTAPSVTIISPANGKKYSRNDSVLIVATITDASPIANVRYYFNGKVVNPAVPLLLSKAPLGSNTVSVVATDSFGNVGSSSVAFRIMPGNGTCIEDIIEAFDHHWIANKNVFKDAFETCKKIKDRGHDHDAKAQKDIDDAFDDLDRKISR